MGSAVDEFVAGAKEAVGAAHVLTGATDTAAHTSDWTRRWVGETPAVVRPGSTGEVAELVGLARAHGVALVPQGGNTGLVGGGVPLAGEVVISLGRMATGFPQAGLVGTQRRDRYWAAATPANIVAMNTNIFRRIATAATLTVAPVLIALGAATVAHADTDAPVHPRTNQEIQQSKLERAKTQKQKIQ